MGNIYEQYEQRGLNNFKLSSLEDVKAIYGFDIPTLKGYSDLSEDNKELFNQFILNFYNAQGMGRRLTIQPLQVNYVQFTEYSRPTIETDDEGNEIHELVLTEIKRRNASGKYVKYLTHKFVKDASTNNCKAYKSFFLRIDYKWSKHKEWLHIIKPDQWY